MRPSKGLSPSAEDYLEAILRLSEESGVARVKDIAKSVGVALSTVSSALKKLARMGLVNYRPYEVVTLTSRGREAAAKVDEKHKILKRFLAGVLNMREDRAEEDACRLEHAISKEAVDQLLTFMRFLDDCPLAREKWMRGFYHYCRERAIDRERCESCMETSYREAMEKIAEKGDDVMGRMSLNQLRPGERGEVVKVSGPSNVQRRVVDMGIVPGTMVEVERVAPLGNPFEIRAKGYHLSLRKEEAEIIEVRKYVEPEE